MALLLIVMNFGAPDAGGVLWACATPDRPTVMRTIRAEERIDIYPLNWGQQPVSPTIVADLGASCRCRLGLELAALPIFKGAVANNGRTLKRAQTIGPERSNLCWGTGPRLPYIRSEPRYAPSRRDLCGS